MRFRFNSTRAKRILLISPLPPPIGGIASWSHNIINYYRINHSELSLFHLNSAMIFRKITASSKPIRLLAGTLDFIFLFFKTVHELCRVRPDVIHYTSSGSLAVIKDFVFVLLSKVFNCRFIIHYHFGRIPHLSKVKNLEWKIIIRCVKMSDASIVLDQDSYNVLKNENANIFKLENPLNDRISEFLKSHPGVKKHNKYNLLFIGHVIKTKGIYELIDVFLKLKERYPLNLEVIGPYELDVYKELTSNCDAVTFSGAKDPEFVYNALTKSNILILPSYSEGFPNVILEGMAIGTNIIATNVGAIPEMLGDGRGIIIEPKSLKELEEAIINVIENELDMGVIAQEFAIKNYSIGTIVKKIENIWFNI